MNLIHTLNTNSFELFNHSRSALNEQIEFHEIPLSSLKSVHWTRSHLTLHIPGLKSDELVSARQASRAGQTSTLSNTTPKHRKLISYRETHPPEYSLRPITAHQTGAECQTTLSAACPPRRFFPLSLSLVLYSHRSFACINIVLSKMAIFSSLIIPPSFSTPLLLLYVSIRRTCSFHPFSHSFFSSSCLISAFPFLMSPYNCKVSYVPILPFKRVLTSALDVPS